MSEALKDQAREALAKAEMDRDAYAEVTLRAKAAEEAELVAPLAERTSALPERLATLRYLAPEDQTLYARDIDGSFVLAWVRASDQASVLAHTERIGKAIHVLSGDDTPVTHKAREMKQREQMAKVNAILERDAKEKADKELAALSARHAEELARIEAERERIRRSPMPLGVRLK
ncbi:MAG: hypothetical protein HEQ38_05090 [Gemmatimonas sp.]|nr:hypothetical protein [Gemmatimonas sp.]